MRIKRAGSSSGGAPTTADYLVGTADAGLSAEIVVGATPGGELGGTWAAPTVDATHSGSTHAATQAAAEATAAADVATHAAISAASTHGNLGHANTLDHANTNDPTANQKAALAGTGVPSGTDKYVNDSDTRMTNARTPTTHGDAQHNALTYEASGAVATHAAISAASTHGNLGHSNANDHANTLDHARQHSVTAAADHTFPGGTTTFLRADGTFAAPTAAAADPSYSPGSFTVVTETGRYIPNHLKLTTTQRATIAGTGRLVLTN